MKHDILKVEDEFQEVSTKTIDTRDRIVLGKYFNSRYNRVRIYKNKAGELLLCPVVEIPASEIWLYENKEALDSVKQGLREAKEGKVSKLDLKRL